MSDDGSVEIAKSCPIVELREVGYPYFIDSPSATGFANIVFIEFRGEADWVLMPTTDELLYCKTGMREALQDYYDRGVTLPDVTGFNMFHDELPNTDKQLWEVYKLGVPDLAFNKPIVFNPELTMNFFYGLHGAAVLGNVVRDNTHEIKLLHYRYWGHEDMIELHKRLWSRCTRINKEANFGGYKPNDDGFYSAVWWENEKLKRTEVI